MLPALSVAVSIFGKWKSFENDLAQSFHMLCNSSITSIQTDFVSHPVILIFVLFIYLFFLFYFLLPLFTLSVSKVKFGTTFHMLCNFPIRSIILYYTFLQEICTFLLSLHRYSKRILFVVFAICSLCKYFPREDKFVVFYLPALHLHPPPLA
jgi:hypothetical protein